ncbi:DegV family protein [Helicovermis profundi]|uniref:DegV family protein n=1 Tax=Helicovermis profundi TaxID=3065157 RepID=A0AAU9E3I6_9FIRM|nr:DegV family protein [Clostridia bacterium S502]
MSFNIIADSSNDMNESINKKYSIDIVPFKLYIDEKEYIDDKDLDILNFIEKMVKSPNVPKSACPSPDDFMKKFDTEDESFVVTISSKLSGTYNSALLAKNMFIEDIRDKFIHVFDSKSASIGETLVSMKIFELKNLGYKNTEIIDNINNYISEMKTFFISESLDNLMKNGRISKFAGTIATVLKIKPIMTTNPDGEIILFEKTRGSKKAFKRLADIIEENSKKVENKVLAISHVNNEKSALWLKEEVEKRCNFKDIIVVQTKGLSSLYCDNGGVIVAF